MTRGAPNGDMRIRPTEPADGALLERLWQLYSHDMSEVRGTFPGTDGLYKRGRLESYLDEAAGDGYLVTYGGAPAGFAFVMHPEGPTRHMGDFFVVRAGRRRGVGQRVARYVVERYPGPWEIAFQGNNRGAPEFWRRVVTDLVGDAWLEELRPVPGKPHIPPDHWLMFTT